uniref:7TM_GPCR_Srx domain-containing protein n=1 Tax=Parastrongyloides trichosuri TaxID=131310 RepID=A0A0N4ZJ55_PARTI
MSLSGVILPVNEIVYTNNANNTIREVGSFTRLFFNKIQRVSFFLISIERLVGTCAFLVYSSPVFYMLGLNFILIPWPIAVVWVEFQSEDIINDDTNNLINGVMLAVTILLFITSYLVNSQLRKFCLNIPLNQKYQLKENITLSIRLLAFLFVSSCAQLLCGTIASILSKKLVNHVSIFDYQMIYHTLIFDLLCLKVLENKKFIAFLLNPHKIGVDNNCLAINTIEKKMYFDYLTKSWQK